MAKHSEINKPTDRLPLDPDDPTRRSFLQAGTGVLLTVGAIGAAGHELIQIKNRSDTEERTQNHSETAAQKDIRQEHFADGAGLFVDAISATVVGGRADTGA